MVQQKKKWVSVGVCLDRETWLLIKEHYPRFNLSKFIRDALVKEFDIVEIPTDASEEAEEVTTNAFDEKS